MGDVISRILKNAKERRLSFDTILFINVNDIELVKSSFDHFKSIFACTDDRILMREMQLLTRQVRKFNPIFQIDLQRLPSIDIVICRNASDISLFNMRNARYVGFIDSSPKSFLGFEKIDDSMFIRNENIISTTGNMNDRSSIIKIHSLKPVKHSYGSYKKIDDGKVDLIFREKKDEDIKSIHPYSETWAFRKAPSNSKIDNEFILRDDISDEDMAKIVKILSHSSERIIMK